MNQALRQRLVGALVLAALGVIFLPALFHGGRPPTVDVMKGVEPMPSVAPVSVDEPVHPAALPPEEAGKDQPAQLYSLDDADTRVVNVPPPDDEPAADEAAPAQETPAVADKPAEKTAESAAAKPAEKSVDKAPEIKAPEMKAPEAKAAETKAAETKAPEKIAEKPAPHPVAATGAAVAPAQDAPALKANGIPQAWALQVGVFTDKAKAEKLRNTLKSKGYRAFTRTTTQDRKKVTRVLVGPELQQTAIAKIKARLEKQQGIKGMVVKFES